MTLADEVTVDIPTARGPMRTYLLRPKEERQYPALLFFSEIFQVTGPIRRTAAMLAGNGFLVAVPEVYHELEEAGTVLAYDQAGSDRGNAHKYAKELESYDADVEALTAYLERYQLCSGHMGAVGICLGGHLAFRAALHPMIRGAACFYATDLHSASLGKGKADDSLRRANEIHGELLMIWGRQDPHVPLEGRTAIKARLEEANVKLQWIEVNAAHAFLRDEGYRHDPVLAAMCFPFVFDLFRRVL